MEMLKMWKFQFAFFQKSYENVLHFRLLLTRVNESKRSVNSVQTFKVLIPFLLIEARIICHRFINLAFRIFVVAILFVILLDFF